MILADSRSSNIFSQQTLGQVRFLLLLVATAHPAFQISLTYFFPEVYDPLWLRLTYSLSLLVLVVWSFSHPKVFMDKLAYIYNYLIYTGFLIVAWTTGNSANNPAWVMGWIMTLFLCQAILESFKEALIFSVVAAGFTWAYNGQVANSQTPVVYLYVLVFSILLLNLFLLRHRVILINALKEQNKFITNQSKELDLQRANSFNSSKLASLGEVAGGIAHEINNPLAIIQGQVFMLKKELTAVDASPATLQKCDDLLSNVTRIASIIKGIRAFSRDASKDPMGEHRIEEILKDSLAFLEEKIKNEHIDLLIEDKAPKDLSVQCRLVEISQVLVNIVLNAIFVIKEQQSEGDRWIKFSTKVLESPRRLLQISISNSGPVIDPKIVDKIFQPFFTTKEVGKGTGLGLSISKSILASHKGDLYVGLTEPQTTFVLELPIGPQS